MGEKDEIENLLKLYSNMVNQIQHYNGVIWQVPTALLAVNALALKDFSSNPFMLIGLMTSLQKGYWTLLKMGKL